MWASCSPGGGPAVSRGGALGPYRGGWEDSEEGLPFHAGLLMQLVTASDAWGY